MAMDMRDFFERLVTEPDEALDMAEAALWVASIGRSKVDTDAALVTLEGLAERAQDGDRKNPAFQAPAVIGRGRSARSRIYRCGAAGLRRIFHIGRDPDLR